MGASRRALTCHLQRLKPPLRCCKLHVWEHKNNPHAANLQHGVKLDPWIQEANPPPHRQTVEQGMAQDRALKHLEACSSTEMLW